MRLPLVFLTVFLPAALAAAQEPLTPSHVSQIEGTAVVYHAGQADAESAALNMPIVQGDRVQTLARARLTVMFPDGASIAIDPESEVEFITATRVRVIAGAIEHLPAQSVDPRSPSAQNLPPDLQPYSPSFDQNGSWQYEPQYGNVWYPTAVSVDWRPYYDGYWSSYPAYGWTWIGYEPWAWPTHHYGRWGYARSRWFWIPGRSYAPAWVSWGTAPGYVSWCPLGYDGRAVVGLSVGFNSSWNAWTVVPRDRFGVHGYPARRYAVEPHRLGSSVAFIEHRTPPARDSRGSFSVAGSPPSVRPGDGRSRSIGTAIPRGQAAGGVGVPTSDYRRNSDSIRSGASSLPYDPRYQSAPRGSTYNGGRIVTGNDQRTLATEQRGNAGDHPDYRPRYAPRYEMTYEAPRRDYPSRDNRASSGSRNTAPEMRPSIQPRRDVREMAPPPARPSPAPSRLEAPPARGSERTNAPARQPHGGGGGERTHQGSSGGTAVRRPR